MTHWKVSADLGRKEKPLYNDDKVVLHFIEELKTLSATVYRVLWLAALIGLAILAAVLIVSR